MHGPSYTLSHTSQVHILSQYAPPFEVASGSDVRGRKQEWYQILQFVMILVKSKITEVLRFSQAISKL